MKLDKKITTKISPVRSSFLTWTGIFFLLFFVSCETSMEQIQRVSYTDSLPDMSATNIEIIYSDSAKIKTRIIAPQLDAYERLEKPYTEFPKGIQAFFYDKDEQINSSLTADYAKYHKSKKLWEAKYKVKLVNTEGDVLKTEHLFADEEEAIIYTDKFVQINDAEGFRVQGEGGFVSNYSFTEYEFKGVSGTFYLGNEN